MTGDLDDYDWVEYDHEEHEEHEKGLPFVQGSRTSAAAAQDAAPRAETLREQVYHLLLEAGDEGLTDEQIERLLKEKHQTISARRRELVQAGRVTDSGRERRNTSGSMATIWVVSGGLVSPKTTKSWKRTTLGKVYKMFGEMGLAINRRGLFWEVRWPTGEVETLESFETVLRNLAARVDR